MAITDTQKVDYLWKKLGYAATKSDTNANKKAPNEAIASPLQLRADKVMTQASSIPSTQPASSAGVLTVYPTSGPIECTLDGTATANRTWKTGQTDWISPEFGSTYQVKVYIHTSSDAAGASGGDQVFATGSGNDDEWFFDYQSGVLHFIGTNLPNGVSFTGKSVYIAGARYSGTFGVGGDTGAFTFTDNRLQTTVSNEEIIIEPSGTGFVLIDTTSGMIVPVGTTGQRPSGQTGMIRFNTSSTQVEVYNGTSWVGVGSVETVSSDEFDGDGITTDFTLSRSSTTGAAIVSINGVVQEYTNTFSISGTTLTFNEAPASDDKIQVRNFFSAQDVNINTSVIKDADNDTKIQVEETADEDLIRFDIAGTEIFTVTSSGIIPSTNSDGTTGYDLGASDYKWRDLYLSGSTIHLGALQLKDNGDNTFGVFQSDGVTEATMSISSEDAAKWTTPRTITLGGDLTGNVSIDGSANVTLTATVAANSVALGTDTTGAYVADVVAGTGISLSETATGAENNTVTVNIDSTVATLTGSQTLTNKTLTSPNLTTPTIGGVAVDEYIADTVGATPQFVGAVLASAGAVRLRMQATGNPADTQNVTFIHDASGGGAYGGMALQNDALTGFRFGLHFQYHPDFTDYPDAAHNIVYGVGLLESGAPAVKATSLMGERVTIAQKWGGGPAPFGVSLGNLYNEPGSLTYNHVKNGTFASDTEWTKGTGWTIAAGVATHASGLESDLSQTINKDLYDDVTYGTLTFTVVAGRNYRLEYTVSGCATGQVQPYVGGTAGTAVSHNGVHSEYITAGADGKVKFTGSTIFDGSIDNVILEETHGFSSDDSVWVAGYNPDGGMIIAGRANASRIVRFMNYGSEVARFGGSADNDYFGINEQSPDRRLHVTDAGTVAKFESSSGAMKIELAGSSTVTVPTIGASGDSVSVDTAAVGGGLQVNLSHASYTGNAFTVQASRAQNAAYSFLAFYSNAGFDLEARCTGEGVFTADGSFTGGGADYAEYFEWADGNPDNEDRRGISVVIEAGRIRPALASDPAMSIVGVVSANPTVVGDAQWNKWVGKYERDDFGAYVMEEYEAVEWTECRLKHEAIPSFTRRVPAQAETVEIDGEKSEIVHPARTIVEPGRDAVYEDVPHSYPVDAVPDGLVPPADAVQTTQRRRKLGDGFDPDADYVPRAQRPEWSPVGLMGKLRVRTGQPVGDRWIRLRAVTAAVEEWLVR